MKVVVINCGGRGTVDLSGTHCVRRKPPRREYCFGRTGDILVKVIMNERTALLGAASYAVGRLNGS